MRCVHILAAATGAAGAVTVSATKACEDIFASIPGYVAFDPLGPQGNRTPDLAATFINTTTSYWDGANVADRPACIVFPANAHHVSIAVKALRRYPSVPFASKSGGHAFNRAWSSTDGGVLISFRPNLAGTVLASGGATADIGPGARWLEVAQALGGSGKTVVGGRIGDVGVGGLLLGGGLSYLSAQYGFASDNVVNYEAVLADGTIVNANASSNRDLYWALRGGGENNTLTSSYSNRPYPSVSSHLVDHTSRSTDAINQGNAFAIVTKFTLRTHDMGDVWGGQRIYSAAQFSTVFSAVTTFIAANKDPKAAIIPTLVAQPAGPGNTTIVSVVYFFYDGPTPPVDVFAAFDAIAAVLDTTHTQRYPQLLDVPGSTPMGLSTTISVQSFPNLPHDDMVAFLDWLWGQVANSTFMRSPADMGIQLLSLALQPIPATLQAASVRQGGGKDASPISQDPAVGDKIWVEYDIAWAGALCDRECPAGLQRLVTQALSHQKSVYGGVRPTHYVSGDRSRAPYNPLFMNDAGIWEDVLVSYGPEKYARLEAIHRRVDPDNFFTTRQRGFFFGKS